MTQVEKVKEASIPKIGGSEEEAKEAVKQLFKKRHDPEKYYKSLSAEDIKELERIHDAEDRDIQNSEMRS